MTSARFAGPLALALLTGIALGQGKSLGDPKLEDFTQTGAQSVGDLAGRTVILEFFAYW